MGVYEHPAVMASKAALSKGKFMFLSPCISPIPATMATSFRGQLDKHGDCWVERLITTTHVIMFSDYWKPPLQGIPFSKHSPGTQIGLRLL